MLDQDLIGIKIGDVNGNAIANSSLSSNRSREIAALQLPSRIVGPGEVVEVPFSISDLASLSGMQLSLKAKGAEMIDITSSHIDLNPDYMRRVSEQEISVAWSSTEKVESGYLFTVTLRALQGGNLDDMLTLEQSRINAEAYDEDYNEYNLSLEFISENAIEDSYQLYQNRPNPFSGETVIGFDLEEAGDATLTVWDISGKALYTTTKNYDRGAHAITLSSDYLTTNGVLYYQLTSKNFTATRKMILID